MKCLKIRSGSLKKCFLLFECILLILLFSGCDEKPVYIASEVGADELWSFSENDTSLGSTKANEESAEEAPAESKPPRMEGTVYYTESGMVWHTDIDCSSLSRAKSIVSGSIDEAIAAGMERACKRCG